MAKRKLIGKIVSLKMEKTAVVEVESYKNIKKYKTRIKSKKKYLAHVENQKDYKVGDLVLIEESRPISKRKRWQLIKKVK